MRAKCVSELKNTLNTRRCVPCACFFACVLTQKTRDTFLLTSNFCACACFMCVSYQPCVRKYNWANLSKTRRQLRLTSIPCRQLLPSPWVFLKLGNLQNNGKTEQEKEKNLKPIFIIVVGCYVFHFLFINLLRNYFFKQCSSVIVKTTAHICSNGVNWLSY